MKHTLSLTVTTNEETHLMTSEGSVDGNIEAIAIGLMFFLYENQHFIKALEKAMLLREEGKIKDVSRTIN